MSGGGSNYTNDTIDCDIRNGGCEHVCVEGQQGGFDHCACFSAGYGLSDNERSCLGEISLRFRH